MALRKFDTKVDQIVMYDGKMCVYCANGETLIGTCIGDCLGTDDTGEDVDGARFLTDDGIEYDLIETDIEKIVFLDNEPAQK